jgi:hypothetical protein
VLADVKSMLSVGLATVSLGGLKIEQVANGTTKMRVLCVGLGGGSLPLFLAHNLPGEPPSTAVKNGVQIVTSTPFFTLRISLVFQQYPGNQSYISGLFLKHILALFPLSFSFGLL